MSWRRNRHDLRPLGATPESLAALAGAHTTALASAMTLFYRSSERPVGSGIGYTIAPKFWGYGFAIDRDLNAALSLGAHGRRVLCLTVSGTETQNGRGRDTTRASCTPKGNGVL